MFWLNVKTTIPKIQIQAYDGSKYSCYFVHLIVKTGGKVDPRGPDESVYYRNKQVIDRMNGLKEWKETKNIAFVSVDEFAAKEDALKEGVFSI